MHTAPPPATHTTANSASLNRWLVIGALIGALLAATGLLESAAPLEAEIIATIDGEPVYLSQFQTYVDALQQNRSERLGPEEREHVLERIIDEKLLIRQGERSGLTRSEPTVRKAIVDAVIENIVSERAGSSADEAELRTFYEQNHSYFSHAALLQVERMVFRSGDAETRAAAAHAALLSGQSFARVKAGADEAILKLPTSPIPATRLANYLGAGQAEQLSEMTAGQFSVPVANGSAYSILLLVAKMPGDTPAFEDIREQVTKEHRRRGNDEALRDYLEQLRDDADIQHNRAGLYPDEAER
jgi:hypothetical protein